MRIETLDARAYCRVVEFEVVASVEQWVLVDSLEDVVGNDAFVFVVAIPEG